MPDPVRNALHIVLDKTVEGSVYVHRLWEAQSKRTVSIDGNVL